MDPKTDVPPVLAGEVRGGVSRFRVEVISDFNSLLALGSEWHHLVEQAGIDHPFLNHDWIVSWWEAFGKTRNRKLNILLVKQGDELVAIAPLMTEWQWMYGIPIRELGF